MRGHRCVADPFGVRLSFDPSSKPSLWFALVLIITQWSAALFEWGTTWLLIQKDNKVYKEDLRAVYDV
jgi:hypothetical protein